MRLKVIWRLLKRTFAEWQKDKASRLAAALAYYTAFSLAPMLIIAIAVAGLVFGQEAAQGEIVAQLQDLVGREGAQVIETAIENARQPRSGIWATIISIALLLFGATGLFTQLQDALNTIWDVKPKPDEGVKKLLKTRVLSFAMVVAIGFLLLASLVVSAALAAIGKYFDNLVPELMFLWQTLNFVISLGVITLLFAMIYKVLPDVKIAWSDVWIGGAITSVLFALGKYLIGLYLGNSSVGSTYGAAGSFVVLLLWINYSAQILFFGAEFTQVYANRYGSRIVPTSHAMFDEGARGDRVSEGVGSRGNGSDR
ncbi:YihY/virulence factor BrkB family protein [Phormidium sp. CCY1219]|uniref:YihY/virulence factor BrkB family protein n=1 Tax=Phormidium sp. CCY1219 TaxID=2886104 RepID=UPI002D1E62CC|nr:YihY/virulence factor BrkB family protein [Phormidium sp. CCY1219]MEB3830340.1 YihY/virulence factor BrkB family protein [Phormidium sp. CCY1219]